MEVIIIPEKEIYLALYTALSETFPKLVDRCNAARGAKWIQPFVEQCGFILTRNCRFDRSSPAQAYRYAYLLKEFLKSDSSLKGLVDRFLLEECIYTPLIPRTSRVIPKPRIRSVSTGMRLNDPLLYSPDR